MSRIRTIKPEAQNSESMGRVSREARLTFILLWPQCDDAGRIRGSSRMLASILFPYDKDAPDLIDGWLAELEKEGCIVRYEVNGDKYLAIVNWHHQKIDKPSPSKLPAPPQNTVKKTGTCPRERSAKPREQSPLYLVPSTSTGIRGSEDQDHSALRAAKAAVARGAEVIRFPTNRFETEGEEVPLFESDVANFEKLYPAVDIGSQLRAMRGWLQSNPTKRKTLRGMMRFVNGWLDDKQNKGNRNGGNNGHGGRSSIVDGINLAIERERHPRVHDRRTQISRISDADLDSAGL